jgi:hypothetical protein
VAPPTPSRTADRQNDMLYEFIFEPAPRLRQHRRKVGFGSFASIGAPGATANHRLC